MNHVRYWGGGPALTALMVDIDLLMDRVVSILRTSSKENSGCSP